jgi:hypothetical protein
MSVKRFAARRDGNEAAIIAALRHCGASVAQISAKGLPDLLIGYQGRTILAETKERKGKLTDAQQEFITSWDGGEIWVIRSVEDAMDMIGAIA